MIINEKLYNDLFLVSHRELAIQSLKTLNKFENVLIIAEKCTNSYFIFEIEIILDEWCRELKPNSNYRFLEFTNMFNYFNFKIVDDYFIYNNFTYLDLLIIKQETLFDIQISKLRRDGTLIESIIKEIDDSDWC